MIQELHLRFIETCMYICLKRLNVLKDKNYDCKAEGLTLFPSSGFQFGNSCCFPFILGLVSALNLRMLRGRGLISFNKEVCKVVNSGFYL